MGLLVGSSSIRCPRKFWGDVHMKGERLSTFRKVEEKEQIPLLRY
jgi:hypothetical protein